MSLRQQYQAFCTAHPLRCRVIAGVRWEYLVGGTGPQVLVLLPGGFGVAATSFLYVQAFETKYRVVSITYPTSVASVADLVDGLAQLLAHEGIAKAHVAGGSYSGLIAQVLVRRHPALVERLILSHTSAPEPTRAHWLEAASVVFRLAPMPLLRGVLRLVNYGFLPGCVEAQRFWREHFSAVIGSSSRDSYLNRLRVAIDFDRNYRFAPTDVHGWPGRLLIIDAEDDSFTPPAQRNALRRLYPQAQHRSFAHGGHGQTVHNPQGEIALIGGFLAEG